MCCHGRRSSRAALAAWHRYVALVRALVEAEAGAALLDEKHLMAPLGWAEYARQGRPVEVLQAAPG